jgi:hypothetical protein
MNMPSPRELIEYVGESDFVTVANVAKVFDIEDALAEVALAACDVKSPESDGVYALALADDGLPMDPDDAVDAWVAAHGNTGIDKPIEVAAPLLPKPATYSETMADVFGVDDPNPEIVAIADSALARTRAPGLPYFSKPGVTEEPVTEMTNEEIDAEINTDLVAAGLPTITETLTVGRAEFDALVARIASLEATVAALTGPTTSEAPRSAPKKKPTTAKQGSQAKGKKPNLKGMLAAGLIAVGDAVYIPASKGADGSQHTATIHDHRHVIDAAGDTVRVNAWAQAATGWKAVNVYENLVHDSTGKTLDELRS